MVELVDTPDLGSGSREWGFESLPGYQYIGSVGEWLKPTVLKTVVPQGTVGSNPTASSKNGNKK